MDTPITFIVIFSSNFCLNPFNLGFPLLGLPSLSRGFLGCVSVWHGSAKH